MQIVLDFHNKHLCFSEVLFKVLSALYAKTLIMLGFAFPIAEAVSPHINPKYFTVRLPHTHHKAVYRFPAQVVKFSIYLI